MAAVALPPSPHNSMGTKPDGFSRAISTTFPGRSDESRIMRITDPTKRYTRGDILGQGACKRVYKCFDEVDGVECAWNQVLLGEFTWASDKERARIFSEIRVLKQLKHKHILALYDYWFDEKEGTLNFVTELFPDGTLRQYRRKHKHVENTVIKRWAWQILQGLVYLHGHSPPIIHRDLKADNIFINGTSGLVKIGDLGFATLWSGQSQAMSVIGTPEFMAPELYEEKYTEKVDIYSFGMCLLELATLEYPYSECKNAAQIFKKVTGGVPPQGLAKVQDEEMKAFIELCICHDVARRPEARQLLKHPFFDSVRGNGSSPNSSLKPGHAVPTASSLGLSTGHAVSSSVTPNTSQPGTPTKQQQQLYQQQQHQLQPALQKAAMNLSKSPTSNGGSVAIGQAMTAAGVAAQAVSDGGACRSGLLSPASTSRPGSNALSGSTTPDGTLAREDVQRQQQIVSNLTTLLAAQQQLQQQQQQQEQPQQAVPPVQLHPGPVQPAVMHSPLGSVSRGPSQGGAPSVAFMPATSPIAASLTQTAIPMPEAARSPFLDATLAMGAVGSKPASVPGPQMLQDAAHQEAADDAAELHEEDMFFYGGHGNGHGGSNGGPHQQWQEEDDSEDEAVEESERRDVFVEMPKRVSLRCQGAHSNHTLNFSMSFSNQQGIRRKVGFSFDLLEDTTADIASEMIENLSLDKGAAMDIARLLEQEVLKHRDMDMANHPEACSTDHQA